MPLHEAFHWFTLAFSLAVAPVFFGLSLAYRRQFRGVVIEWKKAQLVIYTILAFVCNLTLFVLTCFFLAGYLGQIEGVALINVASPHMQRLALDCFLLFGGVALAFLGAQNFLTQYITHHGIYVGGPFFGRRGLRSRLLRWEDIKDYYVRSDYPVSHYHFIIEKPQGNYGRMAFKVPFYAVPRFDVLLEMSLKRHQELREQSRALQRKLSSRN